MTPAVAYLRASDPKQDRSVSDQRAQIEAQAARDGARILPGCWFVDDGLSGMTVEHRPGLLAMRRWVQEHPGEACALYAWSQSRLGRNPAETVATLAMLDAAGVETRFLTDPEPADVDTRDLLRFIRAQIDAQHVRRLKKDVPRGMRAVAAEGRWPYGPPPFGYRVEHHVPGRAGRLVVIPEEAEILGLVADLYEAGDGDKAIAAILTARGVRPPDHPTQIRERAPGTWRPKHVAQILTRATYAGRIEWNGEVLAPNAHEAIIAPERFDRLQALRRSKYREKRRENPVHASERGLFRPWLRCGACGGGMTVTHGHGDNWHYACRVRTENNFACEGVNARVDRLDPLLLDVLAREVLTDEALRAAVERWRTSLDGDGRREDEARRAQIEARITEAQARIGRVLELVGEGEVRQDDAKAALRRHYAARDAAKDELALLPTREPLPAFTDADLASFRRRILDAAAAKPVADRRAALGRLLSSVVLRPGKARVAYRPRLGPENHYHDPPGPPWGSWGQWTQVLDTPEVRSPRKRA